MAVAVTFIVLLGNLYHPLFVFLGNLFPPLFLWFEDSWGFLLAAWPVFAIVYLLLDRLEKRR
jgi:hypothetical protein